VGTYYNPEAAPGSHPTGEYLEWSVRTDGRDMKLAIYVPLTKEQTHNFGQLPRG
jgi:hypothetical protein